MRWIPRDGAAAVLDERPGEDRPPVAIPRSPATLDLPPEFFARTALDRHVADLERAERRLVASAHAGRHGDPDALRETLTRLRHVRARLVEARVGARRSRS